MATVNSLISVTAAVASLAGLWLYFGSDTPGNLVQSSTGPGPRAAALKEIPVNLPRVAISPSPSSPLTAPKVVLSGVAVSPDGDNLAIVSIDRSAETVLRVGDRIGVSATVLQIDDSSMTYRFAGRDIHVIVDALRRVVSTEVRDAPSTKRYPGFIAGAPAMARPPGTEPGSGNEAFREAVQKKMLALSAGR